MSQPWMRAKIDKMKPKCEPRYGLRTLAEHGPGRFHLHPAPIVLEERAKPVTGFAGATVRKIDPEPRREPIRRMGGNWRGPVRSALTADVYAPAGESVLIPARRGVR